MTPTIPTLPESPADQVIALAQQIHVWQKAENLTDSEMLRRLRLPQHVQARSLVENERAHQIDLGFDAAHDAQHTAGELQHAALAYLFASQGRPGAALCWPWPRDEVPFRPATDSFENLVKATALMHAELSRVLLNHPLDRLAVDSHASPLNAAAVGAAACRSDASPEEPLPANPDQAHPPRRAA